MEDKRKNLYDTLVADGYDLGDYDSFSKNINDSSKRKNLYDTVGEESDLGDYNSFESKLGLNIESPVSVDGFVSVNPEIVGMSSIVLNPDRAYKEKEFSPTGDTHDSSEGVPEHLKRPVESPDVIKGFVPAFKQGSDALYQGVKSSVGETANLLNGSQRDYAKAQDQLQELVDSGYDLAKFDKDKALKDYKDRQYRRDMASWDEVMNQRRGERENMGFFDALVHKFKDPDRPRDQYDGSAVAFNKKKVGDEVQLGRAFDAIQEALTQANGDVKRAYALLGEQSAKETWGDKTSREAREAMREFKPTEGAAAWVGNMIPQMAGNAAAIAASVSPWTRWMARPLGAVNMGMLTASSSGSAMAEAREYAEQAGVNVSEGDVLRTGAISGAIEAGTEILPYERFFGGIHNFTANKLGKEVTNAIVGNQAARSELSNIIKKAAKDLPAKVFTKEAGKKFVGDVSVEGFSEFLAEGGGTLVPMIYQNPEDYPTLYEVLENGWEGAKGGIFMGSILGGASSTVGHYQNRARRKQQGEIMLADTQDGVLEVLGHIDGDKYMAVDGNGMPREITRDMVSDFQVVPFGEFDRYCRDQTDENLQKAVDGGRALAAEDIDRREKHAAKLELDKAEQMLSEEQKEGLDISPIEYLSEHENEAGILIPYLNAKSKFDGMIMGIRDGIEEKVTQSNQHIMNLTHQDGNVYDITLTADEKKHVFPISGSIVVDENGIIDRKQSDSRFIVRDDTGKVEMRSIDDLYKLESSDNADILKEVTAQSIREQESARHAEEIETPSEEEKANDGFDDVGIDDYIGANNLSEFGEQRAYEKEEESIDIAKGQAKLSISYRNGEIGARAMLVNDVYGYKDDVSDERLKEQADELSSYWIKRYPEKIKVSDSEREILETNHVNSDVLVEDAVSNEDLLSAEQSNVLEDEKGLAINEMETGSVAGGTIDDIPAGATSIENVSIQEGIVAQSIEPEVPQENQAVVIPVDKKGNKVYHKAPVEVSLQDMRAYGLDDIETDEFVNAQKVEAGKRIEKLEKNKPKVGTNLEKYQANKKAWADELVDAQAQVEYWNEVEAQVLAVREKPGDTTATEINAMGDPMNGSELAAMMLGNGKIPLLYGDYKKETGFKDKEASGMFGTFASKENGGLTIEQAGEQLMLADQEAGTNFFDQEDANAGRNVILDVLSSARTRGDLTGYISKGREAMAERERQAEYEAYEGWCDDTFHMAVEEYEAYEGGIAEDLVKRSLSEDEYNEFMSAFVDELKLNSNEQQGVNGESEGSGSVLHGEELIQTGRTGGIEEESTKVNGGFVDENGFVSESASSGEVDRQGNPIDGQGNLLIDRILNVSDISDYDFISPARNIGLPSVSKNVSDVLGSGEKQIIIKKNILEKNRDNHPEITPDKSRDILQNALYSPTLVGQAQPVKRPNYWVAIETSDKNSVVVLEVNENKDNVEIVGWRLVDRKGLEKLKRQAEREGGQFLIQTSNNDAAAALSTLPSDLSSVDKDSELQLEKQEKEGENYFVAPDHLNGESLFDYAERVASSASLNNGKVTQRGGSILSLDEFLENRPFVNGYLYHGSPDGDLNMIDPFAHTQNWREGIGFYTTESRDAAQMYADGRTAKGERKVSVGNVNYIKPNPDARILDMDAELDAKLWEGIATNMDLYPPMDAKTNREAYLELIEIADDPEAQYAIEEALLANGYDASTHMEGKNGSPHRVTIWKNPDKLPMIARPEDVYSESLPKMDEERFDSNEANDILRQVQGESILDYAERVVKANEITQEREKVNMNPTNAQKEAGNYKKGHVGIDGFDITIENPRGSERSGVDATGETWSITMNNDYGYIRGTVGVDGDHIDVFLSDDPTQGDVFVVDQVKEDGSFDEHKVMYGFTSMDEAKEAYLSNYSLGWEGLGNITGVSKDVFKEWIDSSHRKTKPFAEYKIVQERTEAKPDNNAQYENDSNIRFREDGEMESQESRYATMKELVDHLNEVTGRPTVMAKNADDLLSILESEGIEEWVIRDIRDTFDRAEMENVKFPGFFDSETGKVYLCADQISDLDTLRSSWAHEFNHLATSSVFANNELNDLYDVIGEDGIRGAVPAYYFEEGLSKSMIADEYLSRLMGELASDTEIFDELQNGNIDGLLEDLEFPNDRIIPYISKNLKFIFNGKEEDNRENGSKDGVVDSGRNETSGENQKDTGTEQFRKSESGTERGESRDEISSSVESLCKDLNTLVRIVRDVNKLTDSDRDMLKRKRRSKGWFDPKTSEVVFVLPNAKSIEDAVATVLHEVVAHKGLREMFGKDFDGFLDSVYGGVSEEVRIRISRMAQKHGFDTRIATEEYLASLAERGFEDVHEKSAWEKIKELFSDMLRHVGVKLSKPLGDEDLRYILWKSMNRLKDGDSIVDKAEKIAKDGEVSDRLFRFRGEANDSDAVSDGGQKERLSKIERLQREINGLKGKIRDDKEDVESTVLAMQAFVSGRLSSEAAKEMTKSDIGDLIREIGRATKKRELESPMMAIERLINEVMIRKGSRELFELSRMKVQDSNNRGVSVAKKVDNGTRQVVEWIRNTFSDLITSGMERDIRRLGKEIGVVEREMNGIADSERNDGIYDELNDRLAVLREERDTLKEQRDDLLRNRVEETRGLIEQRMSELESKMQDVAEGRGVFTKDDGIEYDALPIRLMFVETRELTDGLLGIDRDIASVMEENRVLRKAHAEENKKPSPNGDVLCGLKSQMNVNQSKINGLRRERISMQRSLLEKISEANSALREIIETGKSNLQLFHRKLAERKMKLAGMAIGAVKEKRIKGLNEVKGKLERLGESVEDSMQLWKSPFKAPLYSFNFILKHMDRHNFAGDGELYRYFMKSNEGVNMAGDKYYQNWKSHATELEQKMKEVCGKDVDAVMKEQGKVYNHSGIHITMMYDSNTYGKAGTKRELAMSKGQAMYVWMVWQMEDGRAKLESQGYDEESLDEVRAFIGSDYVEFAQWVQDEFYPNLREERYNGTHEHLFGTSMAKRDHYFPLKYTTESGQEKQELGEQVGGMPSLVTGNIINRVRNSRDIDTGLSAFDVMYEYGKNMEEWNAYAAVRRDLNGLVTNRYLRNLMEANEKGLHREFRIACEVATRSFREDDKTGRINSFLTKANKGLAGGAIAWRLNTALKQLLSAPAFLDFSSNPKFIAVLMANSFGIGLDRRGGRKKMVLNYQWCMENLPSFAERIDSGNMGNEKLDDKGFADWIDKYIEMGMIPNKFVDAFTCSVGAKSVYDFARGRYLKAGLSESDAENKAKFDAAIAFNETQQSGRPEYMAAIQSSSHALWKSLTNFQNSNFGFYRKIAESFHDLTLEMQPQVDRIKEELMVTGENERKAERKAWKCVWGTKLDAVKRFALFGEIMSVSWALGSIGLMGWNGGGGDDDEYYDDDEKNSIVVAALFGPIMGTLVLGQFASTVASGNDYQPMMLWGQLSKSWDGLSRAYNERGFFSKPMVYEVCKQAMNTTGIRYETIENMVLGIEGIIRDGDWNMLDTMFLLNTPDSQRKKVTSRMFQKRGLVEYANEMARASKYLSKDGYWWVPGRKSPTEQRMSSIYSEWGKWQLSPENRDRYEKDLDKKRRANKIENNPDYSHQEKQEHIRSILQE